MHKPKSKEKNITQRPKQKLLQTKWLNQFGEGDKHKNKKYKCKTIMTEFYNINYVTSISWFLDSEIGKNFFIHYFFCFRNFSPFLLVTLATATYNCP